MPTEYILKKDGRVVRRPIELQVEGELEIDVDNAILSQIRTNIIRSVRGLGKMGDLNVGLCIVNDTTFYARVFLRNLNLNCTIRADGDYAIPSFEPRGDFVNVQWKIPDDMSLLFGAYINYGVESAYTCEFCYLFAIDPKKAAYVLPLPNLYNDAHICTGQTVYSGATLLECFERVFIGVRDSRWNNHLIHDRGMFEHSQRLFRFKSTKTGFDTVPSETHWSKLSSKVGTDVLNYMAI